MHFWVIVYIMYLHELNTKLIVFLWYIDIVDSVIFESLSTAVSIGYTPNPRCATSLYYDYTKFKN